MPNERSTDQAQTLIPLDYIVSKMRIVSITDETVDTKTFRLEFCDPQQGEQFEFHAGQFGLYSVFGAGEATFCIASSPTQKGYIECSVKRTGKVTNELHQCNLGDIIGFRGPYGNWFPIDLMKDKNLLFIAGGIGLAPLNSLIRILAVALTRVSVGFPPSTQMAWKRLLKISSVTVEPTSGEVW